MDTKDHNFRLLIALVVKMMVLWVKSGHGISEADFSMKTASNLKTDTSFTLKTF